MTEDTKETETPVVVKKQTMEQFKAWLEGVEEMQEDNWYPNASQWKTIRAKFDSIIETKAPAPAPVAPIAAGPMPVHAPPAYREREWSNPPPMPEAEISPAAKALLAGGGAEPRTKTPDVDSADGTFDSPFT